MPGQRVIGQDDPLAQRTASEAARCGVTRLADITGLDRLGIPVWQAVRPWSRTVSVHQGKALDPAGARRGALMEAIESHHAESWSGPVRHARIVDLPAPERPADLDDFADGTDVPDPTAAIDWSPVARLGSTVPLWLPADCLSLDLTYPGATGLDRSSSGQAAGHDLASATLRGLCEVIERDAVGEWQRRSIVARSFDAIDARSITAPWFVDLVRHLSAIDVGVRLYAVPSVIAVPVIACEVVDFSGITVSHSVSLGAAAHPVAEVALRAALLEAAQTRVGCIAGARDDLDLAPPAPLGPPLVLGLPLAPARPRDFATLWPRPRARTDAGRVRGLVAALAAAGYPLVARAILSPSGCAITTAKLFVPGLGDHRRRRRPA